MLVPQSILKIYSRFLSHGILIQCLTTSTRPHTSPSTQPSLPHISSHPLPNPSTPISTHYPSFPIVHPEFPDLAIYLLLSILTTISAIRLSVSDCIVSNLLDSELRRLHSFFKNIILLLLINACSRYSPSKASY